MLVSCGVFWQQTLRLLHKSNDLVWRLPIPVVDSADSNNIQPVWLVPQVECVQGPGLVMSLTLPPTTASSVIICISKYNKVIWIPYSEKPLPMNIFFRAKCVRCTWALQRNVVSTIWDYFSFFFLFSFRVKYFSPRRGYPRVLKLCTEF